MPSVDLWHRTEVAARITAMYLVSSTDTFFHSLGRSINWRWNPLDISDARTGQPMAYPRTIRRLYLPCDERYSTILQGFPYSYSPIY